MSMITGKAYWAKIVGAPVDGYQGAHKEWAMDLSIDEATKQRFIDEGLEEKIKNKDDERGDFVTFRRKSVKRDGTDAKPIRVVDFQKNPWPENQLIGNGSKVNVKYAVNEGPNWISMGIIAVQVVDLVEYEGGGDFEDFPAYDEDGNEENWDD